MYPIWAKSTGRDEIEGPQGASNAVWPVTLCLFRVSDHLFVVGVIKRTFEAPYLPNNTSFYNIIMSSSTPRSAAPLRRSARGGARGFKASSGKQARTQSSGLHMPGDSARVIKGSYCQEMIQAGMRKTGWARRRGRS